MAFLNPKLDEVAAFFNNDSVKLTCSGQGLDALSHHSTIMSLASPFVCVVIETENAPRSFTGTQVCGMNPPE